MFSSPTILAIESSCDETSAAILIGDRVVSNVVAGQVIHERYGGVVPELASRAHQQHIVPVVAQALDEAKITKKELDAVAFTRGPGLLGSLLVGTSFAKAFALSLQIPLIEVNHMQAHVLAHFIEDPKPPFPFLCLTVSGGHTQIVLVESPLQMRVLGETQDDAVGEAFDKSAKMLGLPYPGGPMIDALASTGRADAFSFPLSEMPGLDFSFSGIKTAIGQFLQKQEQKDPGFTERNVADLSASIQASLIQMLMQKIRRAARETGIRHIALAGGVSANRGLRQAMQAWGEQGGVVIYIPDFQYCTDNAGMIAMAAYFKYQAEEWVGQEVSPLPRMAL